MAMHIGLMEFCPPFGEKRTKYRRRTFRCYTGKAGVYLIKDAAGEIVYVGMSQSCVVAALYRHFYPWNDPRGSHYRTVYIKFVEGQDWTAAILITTQDQAPLLEKALIFALQPKDNRERYEMLVEESLQPVSSEPVDLGDDDDVPF